jgi:hypothetical protein
MYGVDVSSLMPFDSKKLSALSNPLVFTLRLDYAAFAYIIITYPIV